MFYFSECYRHLVLYKWIAAYTSLVFVCTSLGDLCIMIKLSGLSGLPQFILFFLFTTFKQCSQSNEINK